MSTETSSAENLPYPVRHRCRRVRALLKHLYEGDGTVPDRFRYGLLTFDVLTVAFIVVTSFLPAYGFLDVIDVALGGVVLADFAARLSIEHDRGREFLRITTWADLIAALSFFAPVWGEGAGFLRILRTLRLLRNYHLLQSLRDDSTFFRRNEDAIVAGLNLAVFVFVMTSVVFTTQNGRNPAIGNYIDALYFTITTLSTTGFGDITLQGSSGRLLSVVIMLAGVTLFLRLAQVLFRPAKVRFPCPSCGLQRHEPDAVHCKACGVVLAIPDQGYD